MVKNKDFTMAFNHSPFWGRTCLILPDAYGMHNILVYTRKCIFLVQGGYLSFLTILK